MLSQQATRQLIKGMTFVGQTLNLRQVDKSQKSQCKLYMSGTPTGTNGGTDVTGGFNLKVSGLLNNMF